MSHDSVWARIGAEIELPRPLAEYRDNEEQLVEDVTAAVRAGKFRISGESYIPESCLPSDWQADDIEFDPEDEIDDC